MWVAGAKGCGPAGDGEDELPILAAATHRAPTTAAADIGGHDRPDASEPCRTISSLRELQFLESARACGTRVRSCTGDGHGNDVRGSHIIELYAHAFDHL